MKVRSIRLLLSGISILMLISQSYAQNGEISRAEANDSSIVAKATITTTDAHTLKTETQGPLAGKYYHNDQGVTYYSYFCRAFTKGSAQLYLIVKVSIPSNGFMIDQAHSMGTKFSLTRVAVDDEFIGVLEHVAINLTRSELVALATEPSPKLEIKLSGKRGNVVVTVDRAYLLGFLEAWKA